MSVVYFQRLKAKGTEDDFNSTYEAEFIAKTNSRLDGPETVKSFAKAQIPAGSIWTWANGETDPTSFARTHDVAPMRPEASLKCWLVKISYRPAKSGEDPQQENPDPLLRPWKISGSFVRFQKRAYKDIAGKPLQNSVEQALPILKNDSKDTLRLEGYTAAISLSLRAACIDHVNSQPIWGIPKRQVQMDRWDFDIEFTNGGVYVLHRLEFLISKEPFNERVADEGTRECINRAQALQGAKYKTTEARDDGQRKIWLDGGFIHPGRGIRIAGVEHDRLATPQNGNIAGGAPFIHDFKVAEEIDFHMIGLPDPLRGPFF